MAENTHFLADLVHEVNSLRDPCKDTFLSPSGLRRLFLLMLRGHWSSGDNHGADLKESLSCLAWNPDAKQRTLDVVLGGTSEAKKASDSAIFVKVNNFRFTKTTFGARSYVSDDNAEIVCTYPTSCQVLFTHEHAFLDTAFDMAWSTFGFFSGYADAISQAIGLETSLEPQVLGEPTQAEAKPQDRYRVDFGMEIKLHVSVSTTEESHRLKRAFDQHTPL